MKKLFIIGLVLWTALLFSFKIDKAHSEVSFAVTHLLISEVTGKFEDFNFEVELDESNKIKKLNGTIKVSSVDTNNARRDGHLRTADYFDIEKYPEITFESTAYRGNSTEGKLDGYLTIKDVREKVTLDVKQSKIVEVQGKKMVAISLAIDIKRKDFNVGEGTPNASISNELSTKVSLRFND